MITFGPKIPEGVTTSFTQWLKLINNESCHFWRGDTICFRPGSLFFKDLMMPFGCENEVTGVLKFVCADPAPEITNDNMQV